MWLTGLMVAFAWLIVPWWALVLALRRGREIERLRERVAALERLTIPGAGIAAVPRQGEAPPPPPAEPIALTRETALPPGPPAAASAPAPAAPHAGRTLDGSRVEQLVGGVWLQNVGSVLLLLGVFFLILWGYTTGRIGPTPLVVAGVALGLALAWRGDRIARRLAAFGHALIGVGLGIVYLSLYLGHFTLRVLPPSLAFGLLAMVALASVATGLRYRAQTLSALGVVGAFVPQLLAAWVPLKGFSLPPPGLLGYFALVDAVVFALAARAGWSALDLTALALTTITWIAAFPRVTFGWGIEIGLSALFVLLGLAPIPRLARQQDGARPADIAVLALAPLCLIAASWPFLAYSSRISAAILLLSLAIVYILAALWAETRPSESGLWRPLTAAAVLFLTAGLQRAVGHEYTPMAWCVEGALLVWLGFDPRGGWLRFLGYLVAGMGALWLVAAIFAGDGWARDQLPVLNPDGVRDLVCLAALLSINYVLRRRGDRLRQGERTFAHLWTVLAQFLLMGWSAREVSHAAYAFEAGGGRWNRFPPVGGPTTSGRLHALTAAFASAAWIVQAITLLRLGLNPRGMVLRVCAYGVSALATAVLVVTLTFFDAWGPGVTPVLYPFGLAGLACGAGLIAAAALLARRRDVLAGIERSLPEAATIAANLVVLAWVTREAGHLAGIGAATPGDRGSRTLAAGLTSAAWTLQAGALLGLGWTRSSAFMRWLGLGLLGLTVLKFLLVDLQQVDVFWRFLTAIVVGAALLGISYLYQRRLRGRDGPPGP